MVVEEYAKISGSPLNPNIFSQNLLECNQLPSRLMLNPNEDDTNQEYEGSNENQCGDGMSMMKTGFRGKKCSRGRGRGFLCQIYILK